MTNHPNRKRAIITSTSLVHHLYVVADYYAEQAKEVRKVAQENPDRATGLERIAVDFDQQEQQCRRFADRLDEAASWSIDGDQLIA